MKPTTPFLPALLLAVSSISAVAADVITGVAPVDIRLRETDGIVIAKGAYPLPTAPTLDSAFQDTGVRMMWFPGKAAFRAGGVFGQGYYAADAWNLSNIGQYSFAVGANTKASGMYSFAAGSSATAGGDGSIAMGINARTTYSNEIAIGYNANGGYSGIAIGPNSSGNFNSIALGFSASAGSSNSAALGSYVSATNNSTAIGYTTTANNYSTALGNLTVASGKYSTSMGYNTTAQAYGSTVVGQFNVKEGSIGSWVATEPLFVVGNGSSAATPANAFTVYKNGDIRIKKVQGDIAVGIFVAP